MITSTLLVCAIILFLIGVWNRNFARKNSPPGPFKWPIVGNFLMMKGKAPHLFAKDLYLKYGPVVRIQIGDCSSVFLTEYDTIKEAFVDKPEIFAPRFPRASREKAFRGMSIIATSGEFHKKARGIASSHITQSRFKKLEEDISHEIELLCDALKETSNGGTLIDPHKYIKSCALNIIFKFLFGKSIRCDYGDNSTNQLVVEINQVVQIAARPFLQDFFPYLTKLLDGRPKVFFERFESLHEYTMSIVNERLKVYDGSTEPTDLLEEYIVRYKKGEIELDAIGFIMIDLILAGTDTSANTILFTISALCDNPDIQEKLFSELNGVIGDRLPHMTDKSALPYTNAVIKESLRRFSVAPLGLTHVATEDTEIRGYTIRKGDQIIQNLYATGLSPKEWNNPEEYDPSRFLNNDSTKYKTVFGCGPRVCLGMSLAESELFLIISTIFKTFKFKSDKRIGTDTIFGVTLSPVAYQVSVDTR
ncbi:cytochrome P450 family protein [Cavenderia fasciculata]|uniref:Cytochrome P450 family protein n=1 Tax=Cavenderia fasciculata TaxID=261658 RepID=F4PVZ8_CACFS|nr:cytochrome P450 family protein [Cavenderia fasciculata]EGG20162.1 cytochrome P450 family protein [Cavenderia fasciculata]|eukprot:XP_004367145.1 cytochrome P450 family protein [Cavenderia fasciculata]